MATLQILARSQVRNDEARRYLTGMRKKHPVLFYEKIPNADPLALRLLQRLLAFDPKDRPTTEEARLRVPEVLLQEIQSLDRLDIKLYKYAQDIFSKQHKQMIQKFDAAASAAEDDDDDDVDLFGEETEEEKKAAEERAVAMKASRKKKDWKVVSSNGCEAMG